MKNLEKETIDTYLSVKFEPLYHKHIEEDRITSIVRNGKIRNIQSLTKNDSRAMAYGVIMLAEREGMHNHADSIRCRFREEALEWGRENSNASKINYSIIDILRCCAVNIAYFHVKQKKWLMENPSVFEEINEYSQKNYKKELKLWKPRSKLVYQYLLQCQKNQ
jgi:hypothetical protein